MMTTLEDLQPDLDAFEACRESLEAAHGDQYVVFHAAAFEGAHDCCFALSLVESPGDLTGLFR